MQNKTKKYRSSVGEAIKSILPCGCIDAYDEFDAIEPDWSSFPSYPVDLFAASAHLIYSSGLLNYFDPNPEMIRSSDPSKASCTFTLNVEEKKKLIESGENWARNSAKIPHSVSEFWNNIYLNMDAPLRASSYEKEKAPLWWKSAISLAIIADEASAGVGLQAKPEYWVANIFRNNYNKSIQNFGDEGFQISRKKPSFTQRTSEDVACILPKLRISSLGCTLRNLSKNLCYVPGSGTMRSNWQQPNDNPANDANGILNILLCPIPLEISEDCINVVPEAMPHGDVRDGWGSFEIKQKWLENSTDQLLHDLQEALLNAKNLSGGNAINAVILPEYSITFELFLEICTKLKSIESGLDFVVAGSSSNCDGEEGNFVLTSVWYGEGKKSILTSRRKHHRWRFSKDQAETYGLRSKLYSDNDWWEKHEIRQRELNFFQFRENSAFTSLICEDLARSDPCHQIIRSVGPNLMFALLMDGAQLPSRWAGRYSSTLTDDPGTSILTFTSFGLVARANDVENKNQNDKKDKRISRSVALWRDQFDGDKQLILEKDAYGILLMLEPDTHEDCTIDGRKKRNWVWKYNDDKPVRIRDR